MNERLVCGCNTSTDLGAWAIQHLHSSDIDFATLGPTGVTAYQNVYEYVSVFINGLRDRTAVFPAFDPRGSVQLTIGRASWADTYYLDFAIDEARFYGEELSDAEVLTVMQGAL